MFERIFGSSNSTSRAGRQDKTRALDSANLQDRALKRLLSTKTRTIDEATMFGFFDALEAKDEQSEKGGRSKLDLTELTRENLMKINQKFPEQVGSLAKLYMGERLKAGLGVPQEVAYLVKNHEWSGSTISAIGVRAALMLPNMEGEGPRTEILNKLLATITASDDRLQAETAAGTLLDLADMKDEPFLQDSARAALAMLLRSSETSCGMSSRSLTVEAALQQLADPSREVTWIGNQIAHLDPEGNSIPGMEEPAQPGTQEVEVPVEDPASMVLERKGPSGGKLRRQDSLGPELLHQDSMGPEISRQNTDFMEPEVPEPLLTTGLPEISEQTVDPEPTESGNPDPTEPVETTVPKEVVEITEPKEEVTIETIEIAPETVEPKILALPDVIEELKGMMFDEDRMIDRLSTYAFHENREIRNYAARELIEYFVKYPVGVGENLAQNFSFSTTEPHPIILAMIMIHNDNDGENKGLEQQAWKRFPGTSRPFGWQSDLMHDLGRSLLDVELNMERSKYLDRPVFYDGAISLNQQDTDDIIRRIKAFANTPCPNLVFSISEDGEHYATVLINRSMKNGELTLSILDPKPRRENECGMLHPDSAFDRIKTALDKARDDNGKKLFAKTEHCLVELEGTAGIPKKDEIESSTILQLESSENLYQMTNGSGLFGLWLAQQIESESGDLKGKNSLQIMDKLTDRFYALSRHEKAQLNLEYRIRLMHKYFDDPTSSNDPIARLMREKR